MDEIVIKQYRRLLREGFQYCGELPNPSIYLDSVGENIRLCGHFAHSYVHVYINVTDDKVGEVKYLCNCDPTTNVVVEYFCKLIDHKTLSELEILTAASFFDAIGSTGEELQKKADAIIELLKRGLERYLSQCK